MQVAKILSDLTSLRVCDHHDALALVTVNERVASGVPEDDQTTSKTQRNDTTNDQLQRAKELVELHYEMKSRHANGTVDEELSRARDGVNRVLRDLQW